MKLFSTVKRFFQKKYKVGNPTRLTHQELLQKIEIQEQEIKENLRGALNAMSDATSTIKEAKCG